MFILICLLSYLLKEGFGDHTFCIYDDFFNNVVTTNISNDEVYFPDMGIIYKYNKTIKCPDGKNFCFTAWKVGSNDTIKIMKQGCWTDPAGSSCFNHDCISESLPKGKFNSQFCCCQGSYCNQNFKQIVIKINEPPQISLNITDIMTSSKTNISKTKFIFIGAGTLILFLICTLIVFLFMKGVYSKYRDEIKKDLQNNAPRLNANSNEFSNLELIEIIDRGRYGTIWKGKFMDNDQNVVVKVFKNAYHSYYSNERDIYSLPYMDHPNLLKYFGCKETTPDKSSMEYWIVLSYVPDGCLQNFIKMNTITGSQFVNIFASLSRGLSHLQKLIFHHEKVKSPIAHRDLNTRNILISNHGNTCIICDLGFAYQLNAPSGKCSKLPKDGRKVTNINDFNHKNVEKTLADVGTIRYMAPEVLEGSIDLRDCEAALKQVDIYALALVMWEVALRCQDFYDDQSDVPQYQLPFQKEIGLHPTFEDMQILVARNKCRPTFPANWKQDFEVIRLVKETLEHCWDQDAEARLSAFCVEERVRELVTHWISSSRSDSRIGDVHLDKDDMVGLYPGANKCFFPAEESTSFLTDRTERSYLDNNLTAAQNTEKDDPESLLTLNPLINNADLRSIAFKPPFRFAPIDSGSSDKFQSDNSNRQLLSPKHIKCQSTRSHNEHGDKSPPNMANKVKVMPKDIFASILMRPLKELRMFKGHEPNHKYKTTLTEVPKDDDAEKYRP